MNRRLRALLLAFASYIAPPPSLTSTTPARITRLPRDILTDDLVEEIKTRLCFVGGENSHTTDEAQAGSGDLEIPQVRDDLNKLDEDEAIVAHLFERYSRTAPATKPVSFRVPTLRGGPTLSSANGHSGGRGWVELPGWVRERAAEVLWEDEGDHDARGLADVVLECLLRVSFSQTVSGSYATIMADAYVLATAAYRFAKTDGDFDSRDGRNRRHARVLFPLQIVTRSSSRAIASAVPAVVAGTFFSRANVYRFRRGSH